MRGGLMMRGLLVAALSVILIAPLGVAAGLFLAVGLGVAVTVGSALYLALGVGALLVNIPAPEPVEVTR